MLPSTKQQDRREESRQAQQGEEVGVCHRSPARDGGGVCSCVLLEMVKDSDGGGYMRKRRTPGETWLGSDVGETQAW